MQSYRRNYRRLYQPGGTYFFTLTLADRRQNTLVRQFELLRSALLTEKAHHPFTLLAWVVLPDHLHMLWRLPQGDADYSDRLRRFKSAFSRKLRNLEPLSSSRLNKGERGIWQRRFWEHLIRGTDDLRTHIDYVHYNPVKHGYAKNAADWPHSSFQHFVARGYYPASWAWPED